MPKFKLKCTYLHDASVFVIVWHLSEIQIFGGKQFFPVFSKVWRIWFKLLSLGKFYNYLAMLKHRDMSGGFCQLSHRPISEVCGPEGGSMLGHDKFTAQIIQSWRASRSLSLLCLLESHPALRRVPCPWMARGFERTIIQLSAPRERKRGRKGGSTGLG